MGLSLVLSTLRYISRYSVEFDSYQTNFFINFKLLGHLDEYSYQTNHNFYGM